MRLALVATAQGPRVAIELAEGFAVTATTSLQDVIAAGPRELVRLAENVEREVRAADVRLLAPIPSPGKVICAGVNYRSHLDENPNARLPHRPYFFAKLPSSVIGPNDAIVKPTPTTELDPEVELAVVVGRRARALTRADALGSVFGYTILNDVSARDWQFASDGQMMLGKGIDTFCPIGPVVVTADELTDPSALTLSTSVNGEIGHA